MQDSLFGKKFRMRLRKKLRFISPAHGTKALLQKVRGVRGYDFADENGTMANEEIMVAPVVTNGGNKLMNLGPGRYTPPFKAQIQLRYEKLYFTEAAGVYTPIAPAALGAGLNVALPLFIFANSDFAAGWAKLKAQFPLNLWAYNAPVIFGKQIPYSTTRPLANGLWDANVTPLLRNGDIVLPFTATVAAVNYVALIIIRSQDVPIATLFDATNSNTFNINLVRYTVTLGQEAQFANAILITDLTMFGKFSSDPINPNAFKNPEQNQANIIDIDAAVDINKQKGIAIETNFDVLTFDLNLFVANASKIV